MSPNKSLRLTFALILTATFVYFCSFVISLFYFSGIKSSQNFVTSQQTSVDLDFFGIGDFTGLDISSLHQQSEHQTFAEQIHAIRNTIETVCPYGTDPSSTRCNPLRKRPWLIMGTAGTGTRVIHDILDYLGIKMSKLTNKQKDSRVFIELIKKAEFFSSMPSNVPPDYNSSLLLKPSDNGTIFEWMTRNSVHFNMVEIDQDIRISVLSALETVHKIISQEIYSRYIDPEVEWGFKEPQLMFVLPFINQLYSNLYQNISELLIGNRVKLVHVIRDGRDIAFSKQHLHKYQQLYTQEIYNALPAIDLNLFLNHAIQLAFSSNSCLRNMSTHDCIKPFLDRVSYEQMLIHGMPQEWLFRIKVSRVWSSMNLLIRKYILASAKNSIYIPVKLENICDRESAMFTLSRILTEGRLNFELEQFETFIDKMEVEKCRLGKFLNHDPILAFILEGVAYEGLRALDYKIYGKGWPDVISSNSSSYAPRGDIKSLAINIINAVKSTNSAQNISIIVFSTRKYIPVLLNWLVYAARSIKASDECRIFLVIITSDTEVYRTLLGNSEGHDTRDENLNLLKRTFPDILKSLSSHIRVVPHLVETAPLSGRPEISNHDIWTYRLRAAISLLKLGHYVILSDSDAIFIKSPLPLLKLPHDVIASKGRFPYALASKWGAAACMGWIAFKASAITLLEQVFLQIQSINDDQIAINSVFDTLGVSWSNQVYYVNQTEYPVMESKTDLGTIALLDFETIPRFCDDDIKENEVSKRDQVSRNSISDIYPNALVLHCYTPKDGHVKEVWLRRRKLWILNV